MWAEVAARCRWRVRGDGPARPARRGAAGDRGGDVGGSSGAMRGISERSTGVAHPDGTFWCA